ncbi:DUF6965 family protein [Pedobacter sp. NJ-S-72]
MTIAEFEIFFNSKTLPEKLILRYGVCTNVAGAADGLISTIRASTNPELIKINMLHLGELKNAIDNFNPGDYITSMIH